MKALEPRIDEAARRMAEDVAEAVVSGRGTESKDAPPKIQNIQWK